MGENDAVFFATAAVDMWQRALQSLMVALAASTSSETWACSIGYYASHYSMRAFAHLFGYFALYRRRLIIELTPFGNLYRCDAISGLPGGSREHRSYWTVTKRLSLFVNDALFTVNDEQVAKSDAAHRGVASYADHLNRFAAFVSVNKDWMRRVLIQLAHSALAGEASVELPDSSDFPQLDAVLTVAYLRIYRFREHLDLLLGRPGRFWDRHRTPGWCGDLIAFPPRQSPRVLVGD